MGKVEYIDFDELVDNEEELRGFHREINRLLKINTRNDYYIDNEIFGYGLEIEVSAKVQRTHFMFLKAMLNNIINVVNYRGNFVFDRTIKGDYGFEICLDPLDKDECIRVYSKIREIIDFSSGILDVGPDSGCGLHINIKADERIKSEKFLALFELLNPLDDESFSFNEYKRIVDKGNYDNYLEYQKEISGKYLAVNLLKENLIELRCINSMIPIDKFSQLLEQIELIFGGSDESYITSSVEE
ncbi:MAG: hypothetical protein RR577_02085 [Erysipelotrichales bacterium]